MGTDGTNNVYTCITCSVAFYTPEEQREHFRADLHRYNMKRRVANLAPVSAHVFNQKILERRAAMEQSAQEPEETHDRCEPCGKTFSSENAFRDHMQSKKHKEMVKKGGRKKSAAAPSKSAAATPSGLEETDTMREALDENDDETRMEREIQQRLAKARRIDPSTECLFCGQSQSSLDSSVSHMSSVHGFFVPERKYLVDFEGLLRYLADKVAVGHVCLWCNGHGRGFHDLGAVRKHMLDKSHCKVAYDRQEDQLELSDFYDFRSSYPDAQKLAERADGWEDMSDGNADDDAGDAVWEDASDDDVPDEGVRYGDSEYELVLPSGARLGHRSMHRYYRQSYWQTPATHAHESAAASSGRALAHRIAGAGDAPGDLVVPNRGGAVVTRNRGEAREATRHVREFRDQARREQFKTRVGFRHNHQKHFRDQLLQ